MIINTSLCGNLLTWREGEGRGKKKKKWSQSHTTPLMHTMPLTAFLSFFIFCYLFLPGTMLLNMSLCGNLLATSTNDHLVKIWDVSCSEDSSSSNDESEYVQEIDIQNGRSKVKKDKEHAKGE
jgi:hypothetical protein